MRLSYLSARITCTFGLHPRSARAQMMLYSGHKKNYMPSKRHVIVLLNAKLDEEKIPSKLPEDVKDYAIYFVYFLNLFKYNLKLEIGQLIICL